MVRLLDREDLTGRDFDAPDQKGSEKPLMTFFQQYQQWNLRVFSPLEPVTQRNGVKVKR